MGIEKKWLRCRTIIPYKTYYEFCPWIFFEKFNQDATIWSLSSSNWQNKL